MIELWRLALTRSPELQQRLIEHVYLAGISTAIAVGLGAPMGILALRSKYAQSVLLGGASVLQTIPSLALLTFLLPFFGIGATPAIIALILYALLPIVRNTHAGLSATPPLMLEMADALGMTRFQRLWMIEARFAAPIIMAGIRTATTVSIGIATLSAFVGAGGLGAFINRGLSLNNMSLVLLGAIPAAILALYADWALGIVETGLQPGKNRTGLKVQAIAAIGIGVLAYGSLAMRARAVAAPLADRGPTEGVVTVGSKNFTEQLILGEIVAQALETSTNLKVQRKLNLAGTAVCQQALIDGGIDVYPEYTGTALLTVLKIPAPSDSTKAWVLAKDEYAKRFDLEWLPPLGFANTYALAVTKKAAIQHGWTKISDLARGARKIRAGFTSEFLERRDGYPGLAKRYGIRFGSAVDLDPGLMYEALGDGRVDVISAFSTDGRIAAYNFTLLKDDRHFFPPYDAALVVRGQTLDKWPEVRQVLTRLSGRLTAETMRRLNLSVDRDKKSPREVAREFLEDIGWNKSQAIAPPPVPTP